MNDVRLCMVVLADDVTLARQLAAALGGPSGVGMWSAACSADGQAPATHYIAHGHIGPEFAAMVTGGAAAVLAAMSAAGMPASGEVQAAVEHLMAHADVSEDWPDEAKARLNLVSVQESNDDPE